MAHGAKVQGRRGEGRGCDAAASPSSLAARGVVSSLCSRNDPSAVRAHLQCLGMWEWFVFASANPNLRPKTSPNPSLHPNQVRLRIGIVGDA